VNGTAPRVRCILRDVTLRNQRERRLAMQLGVGASRPGGLYRGLVAAHPLTLGSHLGFDLVELWRVDSGHQVLRYGSMWMAADCVFPSTLAKSSISEFSPERAYLGRLVQGASIWVRTFTATSGSTHVTRKVGWPDHIWGVPVRVGNQVIAVIEFFSRKRMAAEWKSWPP